MRSVGGAKDASENSGSVAPTGAGASAQDASATQSSSAPGSLPMSIFRAAIMRIRLVDLVSWPRAAAARSDAVCDGCFRMATAAIARTVRTTIPGPPALDYASAISTFQDD